MEFLGRVFFSALVLNSFILVSNGQAGLRPPRISGGSIVPPIVRSGGGSGYSTPSRSYSQPSRPSGDAFGWGDAWGGEESAPAPAPAPAPAIVSCALPLVLPTFSRIEVVRSVSVAQDYLKFWHDSARRAIGAVENSFARGLEGARAAVHRGMPYEAPYAAAVTSVAGALETLTGAQDMAERLERISVTASDLGRRYGHASRVPDHIQKGFTEAVASVYEEYNIQSVDRAQLQKELFRDDGTSHVDGQMKHRWRQERLTGLAVDPSTWVKNEVKHNLDVTTDPVKHMAGHYTSVLHALIDGDRADDAEALKNIGDLDAIKNGDDH